MVRPSTSASRWVCGVAIAVVVGLALAEDAAPPRLAEDIPAFQAPAEPPATPVAPAVTEPEGALTLADALAQALMGNPELQAFSWETRAAEARTLQARKLPNPELAFRISQLDVQAEDPTTDEEDAATRLILSQVFELGGKRKGRTGIAQAERDIAGWDYEAKRVEVATLVATHFVAVVGAQRQVEIGEAYVSFLEDMHRRASSMVEIGTLPAVELLDVQRRLGLARIELRRAESGLGAARLKLAATWGSRAPRFTSAEGNLEALPPIPSLESVVGLLDGSPAVARFEAEQRLGEAALAYARATRVPDFEAGVGVRWDDGTARRDYLADLRFDIPLFDRKQGDVQEARHGLERIAAERSAAQALAAAEVAEFYHPWVEAEARRGLLNSEVLPAARAAFEAHRQGLEVSTTGFDDVVNARSDLADAEFAYVDALVEVHQALAGLEGVLGRSLDGAP